jgi:hypothetical protein
VLFHSTLTGIQTHSITTELTKEQWADSTDSFNDFEFYKIDREERGAEAVR